MANCWNCFLDSGALEMNGNRFLFDGLHSASGQTSARQTLHLTKSVCVGLALSPLIDSSVLGMVCFTHPWKCGLCPQAPQLSLSELMRSCGSDMDCSRTAILSLTSVLTALVGLHCQMMVHVFPPCWLPGDGFVSWIGLQSVWGMNPISRQA